MFKFSQIRTNNLKAILISSTNPSVCFLDFEVLIGPRKARPIWLYEQTHSSPIQPTNSRSQPLTYPYDP
jgi:hypothetical protein